MSSRTHPPDDGSGDADAPLAKRLRLSEDSPVKCEDCSTALSEKIATELCVSAKDAEADSSISISPSSPVSSTSTAVEGDSSFEKSDDNDSVLTAVSPFSSPQKVRIYRSQVRSPHKNGTFKKRPDTPMPFRGIVGRLPFPSDHTSDEDSDHLSLDEKLKMILDESKVRDRSA